MGDAEAMPKFGCERCWLADAGESWEARSALSQLAELIDDLHFGATILACTTCGQRFLSIFEEQVDWVDGDDPQYWTLLPLTVAEAAQLVESGAADSRAQLSALGPGRRSLRHDCPKGEPPRTFWATGVSVP